MLNVQPQFYKHNVSRSAFSCFKSLKTYRHLVKMMRSKVKPNKAISTCKAIQK